jgi:hypothetical protein
MSSMFEGCLAYDKSVDFDTSQVLRMNSMFKNCAFSGNDCSNWNVENVLDFTDFMSTQTPATFSTTNLDNIYNAWSLQAVQSGLNISFGTAKYTLTGLVGRDILTGTYSWSITDGGL